MHAHPPLDTQLHERIRQLAKVELHLHLEGSISPETLLDLAKKHQFTIPAKFATPDLVRSHYSRYKDFRDFVNIFILGVNCLKTPEDFYLVMKQLGARLASQNVLYAEVTWTPQFYLLRPCGLDSILRVLNQARREIETELGIRVRWIPDLIRNFPKPAPKVTQWLIQQMRRGDSGIVALGLGGPEYAHPASNFELIFQAARECGLPANPHAGENDGPISVRNTLHCLQPRRIGHGVRASEDPELMALLRTQRTHLEVCLSSNIQLGIYADFEQHPLRTLLDAGCELSLHTDDPVLFQTSLNQEYQYALEYCGMHWNELLQSINAALNASYLDESTKRILQKELSRNSMV
ncbi:adenosine deaminase [Undibacterium fentianense]|uniref:Adenosine deaminase n=1 Tax=Undibacterium fentianense TaxID=2828728 RepID=A0A941IEV9_9BURK|nr:adenosine deaminase [Undibacterium fentianense]MBR7799787.1 adenosine deaminase [Undibacterium fentianense]